jgi:hypothetical protein
MGQWNMQEFAIFRTFLAFSGATRFAFCEGFPADRSLLDDEREVEFSVRSLFD